LLSNFLTFSLSHFLIFSPSQFCNVTGLHALLFESRLHVRRAERWGMAALGFASLGHGTRLVLGRYDRWLPIWFGARL
jgi:hypothetical protein